MNILHVLAQFEVTGAEVYAVTLATEQQQRGHSVLIISDTLHTPFDGAVIQHPIGVRSYGQRVGNILFLIRLIREKNIHIVHAHCRAASWVCHFATRMTNTPYVSTIHGRQHLHLTSTTWSVYGKNVIVVSESLQEHLISELGINPHHITVIPNGLDTHHWIKRQTTRSASELFGTSPEIPVILFVGRLSGPKGDVVRLLVSEVYPTLAQHIPCSLHIIGGLQVPPDIPQRVQQIRNQFGPTSVMLREFQSDLVPYLQAADVVIGSGRVALESLLSEKPTFAYGESTYEGLVTTENVDAICQSNFGDTGLSKPVDPDVVKKDLVTLLGKVLALRNGKTKDHQHTERSSLQKRICERYDIKVVSQAIDAVYQKALLTAKSPSSIPVLMYHRIVAEKPEGSRHGIWVTAKDFERQLHSLRRRSYTPITFIQYQQFLKGEFSLPHKPIVLTFDDGYEDNYIQAFPLLKKFGFTAVVYVVTDIVRRTNFWDADEPQVPLMTQQQILKMSEYGIEFGSHTVTHAHLSHCSSERIQTELAESKKTLEQWLGKSVTSFAYPYGALNETIKSLTAKAGYSFGIAVYSGPLVFYDDFFEIRRTQIFPWTSRYGFWKKTQEWYLRYKQRKENKR